MSDAPVPKNVAKAIAGYLNSCPVRRELKGCRDERPFRRWVGEQIRGWVEENYGRDFPVRIETSEGGVYPVKAFGTSFWPDVSVESPDARAFLAVEVKCLRRRGLPGHIAQALGQALLYKDPYQDSLVVFVLTEPLEAPALRDIAQRLARSEIESTFVEAFP